MRVRPNNKIQTPIVHQQTAMIIAGLNNQLLHTV